MELENLHVLSAYLKKWSYQENRLSFSYSYFTERGYGRDFVDMRVAAPQNMVNDFLNRLMYRAKEKGSGSLRIVNESDVQRKLNLFFGKILKEFNTNKRSRGRIRMISNRSMDFYYNDFEYQPLEDSVKFYVHLNRGVNKMNGDLWSAAIDDLNQALAFNPDNPQVNKYLAEALVKSHRIEEAIPYYQKYAETEESLEGLNDLAHAYIKIERFKEAEQVFKRMKKLEPDDLLARIGQAQISYLEDKDYMKHLEEVFEIDPDWLRDYLKKSWGYKLPGFGSDESKMWNAATASRYLGYDRPFDLTKRAFNDEIPCYFDSEKGTIRFVKAELDHWVEIQNRFRVDGQGYKVYPDRLNEKELEVGQIKRTRTKTKRKTKV